MNRAVAESWPSFPMTRRLRRSIKRNSPDLTRPGTLSDWVRCVRHPKFTISRSGNAVMGLLLVDGSCGGGRPARCYGHHTVRWPDVLVHFSAYNRPIMVTVFPPTTPKLGDEDENSGSGSFNRDAQVSHATAS